MCYIRGIQLFGSISNYIKQVIYPLFTLYYISYLFKSKVATDEWFDLFNKLSLRIMKKIKRLLKIRRKIKKSRLIKKLKFPLDSDKLIKLPVTYISGNFKNIGIYANSCY